MWKRNSNQNIYHTSGKCIIYDNCPIGHSGSDCGFACREIRMGTDSPKGDCPGNKWAYNVGTPGSLSSTCNLVHNTAYLTLGGNTTFIDAQTVPPQCCMLPLNDSHNIDTYCSPDYDPRNPYNSFCVDVMSDYCEEDWKNKCQSWFDVNKNLATLVVEKSIQNYVAKKVKESGIPYGYYNPKNPPSK
jgi:hypothetical protein